MVTVANPRSGWWIARWLGGGALLAIPAVMMQVSGEWDWGATSFIIAATIIFGGLTTYELLIRISGNLAYRAAAATALAAAFLLVWINLAVGIIGNEDNPVNLSFFGIVATAAVGAFAAGFRAAGMARAMLAVASTQMVLAIIITTAPSTAAEPHGAIGVLVLSGFFAGLWLIAAALFRQAACTGNSP